MRQLIEDRTVFLAVLDGEIVGKASLDQKVVPPVLISSAIHGRGIGTHLIAHLEQEARKNGIDVLTVPSSVTAERFYSRLGFSVISLCLITSTFIERLGVLAAKVAWAHPGDPEKFAIEVRFCLETRLEYDGGYRQVEAIRLRGECCTKFPSLRRWFLAR